MKSLDKILIATIVFVIATVLMILVQIPTPEYLNLAGCIFGVVALVSGLYAAIALLFTFG